MGRGKPFVQRAVRAGRNVALAATPPQFEAVSRTKPPRLTYPEDRLRAIYLSRNPAARRIPLDLGAASMSERHIADRFVALQMRLMDDDKLNESGAYDKAERIVAAEMLALRNAVDQVEHEDSFDTPLVEDSVEHVSTRIYLASLRDSQRDVRLHRALVQDASSD